MRESFASQLRSVPGVQTVTPARVLTVKAASGSLPAGVDTDFQFFYETLDPATFRQIGDMEFAANQGDPEVSWRRLSQGRAIFISNMVADRYDLHQGDELVLLTRRGEQPFYIAAEVTDFGGQGQVIYGTYDDMHRWFNEQGVDRFTLNLTPGASIDAVSQEIERRYKDSQNLSLQTTQAFKKSILDLVNQSFRLFDVLNLIAVIIGALSVINTLTMNVIERQREIGGLRSLGMQRRQVLRMVLAESLALGLMGGAYGFVIGYFIAQVVILGTNMMAGYDLIYQFTPKPYLIGALIALVFVQAAAIYPARRAAQVNIIEAIKHE
jgi:putative ABC transport system permease protein